MSRARDTADQINRVNSSAADATAITVDSSETVGIGVTPSPWRSLYGDKQVDIGAHSSVYSEAGNTTYLANNFYRNASNAFIYKTTSGASYVSLSQEKVIFAGAASGTAGNSFSFSERARFDSDGLKFNGDTAAANALDDYEEGNWTPVGATGFPVSLSSINASYTKVGELVSVRANFIARNDGTTLYISGLPFTSSVNCAASISVSDGTAVTGERITAEGFRCFIASTISSNVAYYLEATYETNS